MTTPAPPKETTSLQTCGADVSQTVDPHPYSWRDVEQTAPDGSLELLRVPLTLEDILHPQFGDFRVHNDGYQGFIITCRMP